MTQPSSPPTSSPLGRLLVGSFLLALVVRLLYVWAFRSSPYFDHLLVDAQWHDDWAWDWARGTWSMEGRAFFRAPLYPLWLTSLFTVFGHDLLAVRVVEAVVGASAAAALAGAAARAVGIRAGAWAGALTALHGPLVYFGGEILIPNLLVALLSWALFLAAGGPRQRLVAAAMLGLAGIARPNALVVLLPLGWLALRGRAGGARLRAAGGVIALGLLPALVVSLVNLRAEGTFVFVASQGGVNFAAGNHAGATGRSIQIPELETVIHWQEFLERSETVAEEAVGRPLDSREVSDFWAARAWSWIGENPGDALGLTLRKTYYLVNAVEVPNNRDPYFLQPWPLRPLLWKTPFLAFPWGLVFPLAVAGLLVGLRDLRIRGFTGALGVWVLLYGASLVPFFICARFRMGMVPALIVLAAVALARWRDLARPAPAVAGLVALVIVNTGFFQARVDNPAQEMTKLGATLLEAGRMDEGIAQLERAVELQPDRVAPIYILADAYLETGRYEEARGLFERVVARRPGDAKARFSLGVTYLQIGRYDLARNELDLATQRDPDDAASWVNLGAAWEGMGKPEEAIAAYRRGIEIAPRAELGYFRLGSLLAQRGDMDGAIAVFDEGVARIRTTFLLRYQLAAALAQTGRYTRALEEIDSALALQSDNPDALRLQAWLGERIRENR